MLAEGLTLASNSPSSESEWEAWQRSEKLWVQRSIEWLAAEVSNAAALAFANPVPMAARIRGSYNSAHNDRRLALQWRVQWLQRLKDAGP